MPVPVIGKLKKGFVGNGGIVDAANVETIANETNSNTNAQSALTDLFNQVNVALASASVSGRGFRRFNTDLEIASVTSGETLLSIAEANDTNLIYTARVNKVVEVILPSDTEIVNGGVAYPIAIEFTHLAGTMRNPIEGDNRIRINLDSQDTSNISTSSGLVNLRTIDMLQGDVVVLTKETSSSNWFASYSLHDPNTLILPNGVFELRQDMTIQNIVNLSTELNGVTINAGDAFIVETGGIYFGDDISDNDVIVSLTTNPNLTTNDGEDWLILSNGGLSNNERAFFSNISRNGNRFDLSERVFVSESNVISFNSIATNTPKRLLYFTTNNEPTTSRTLTYADQDIQFSNLKGGTLTLAVQFEESSSSGFLPELIDITFDFDGTLFTFPLIDVGTSGNATIDITIPNQDYSSILNTNCDITLNYNFRGVNFIGFLTINNLVNTLDGTLRQSILNIANQSSAMAEARVNTRIDGLAQEIDTDNSALQSIQPRLSPYQNIQRRVADIHALFLNSTGSDSFPSDLSTFNQVSANNPQFTGGDIALFVAVVANGNHVLKNITNNDQLALDDSETNVDLGESLTFNNQTYFVYRITSLTSSHVYEIDNITLEQVVKWENDINNLQDEVERIDAELEHSLLNLDDEVVHYIENEVNVTEEASPTISATEYNIGLGSGNNQKVFYEPNANTASSGNLTSRPFSELSGGQVNNKLAYFNMGNAFTNQNILWAFDGTTQRNLIEYRNGTFFGKVFVPAQLASTASETIYPSPPLQVSGKGIWITIPALIFVNGIPSVEANRISFTRNIPSVASTLTIQYRGHANGNIFGTNSITLANVGGDSDVSATFTLDDGSETATVEVLYRHSSRDIRVSVTERVNTGLPTINDVEVILSFTETRTIPPTDATVRDVNIGNVQGDKAHVFAVKPSATSTLILVSDTTEIDTNYPYNVLFDTDSSGHLSIATDQGVFLNYEDFDPIYATVVSLENHATLPQYGLFSTKYTENTVLNFETQVTSLDDKGNVINLGKELIVESEDGTKYRLVVSNAGLLDTELVP